MKKLTTFLISGLALVGCASTKIDARPVTGFDADRYLGKWYEIARLDHKFERGMTDVTATYSLRDGGKLTVMNRGFKRKKGKFKDAKGKAKFEDARTTGHLKVSFFGPFYGDYIIFGLDKENYSYAYISGGKDKYLWLLARTPTVSDAVKQDFLTRSRALGYETDGLIWVPQTRGE
ncbi:MAG: lipocalin [Hellea sp.]|nr:lipocalin [Hellea sp.]